MFGNGYEDVSTTKKGKVSVYSLGNYTDSEGDGKETLTIGKRIRRDQHTAGGKTV